MMRLALVALAGAVVLSAPLAAQELSAAETPMAPPVCMVAPNGLQVPNVSRDKTDPAGRSNGRSFVALAVEETAATFEAKGFVRVDCQTTRFARTARQIRYRDRVCQLASELNEAAQNQLERRIGERPSVLCTNAQLVVGAYARDTRPLRSRRRAQ